jgi:hypothetical protein
MNPLVAPVTQSNDIFDPMVSIGSAHSAMLFVVPLEVLATGALDAFEPVALES